MAIKKFLTLLLLLNVASFFAQVKRSRADSLRAAQSVPAKDYSTNYKATVLDSATFTGEFLDMNYGGSCMHSPNAGIGIFKVVETSKKLTVDTISVIIQCAFDGPYKTLFVKGQKYKMKVTPYRVKYWVDVQWDQYERMKRFFLIGKDPVKK